MKIRGVRRLATALALTVTGAVLVATTPATPARAASDQPPVAVDDTVRIYAGDLQTVDVLGNDSDPDGDAVLQACRVGTPSTRHIHITPPALTELANAYGASPTNNLELSVDPETPTGTYTVRYQACDTDYLVPATLTVQVIRLPQVRVTRMPHRPGHLRVTNPGDLKAIVGWMAPHGDDLDGVTRVLPHRSTVIAVTRHRIRWFAATAGSAHHYLGTGVVSHIRLPSGRPASASASRPDPALVGAVGRFLRQPTSPLDRTRTDDPYAPWPPSTFLPVDLSTTVPPTAVADARKVWAGLEEIDALANDSDPAGGRLDICRVDVRDRRLVAAPIAGQLLVDTTRARAGDHTVTYYACNAHRLAAATLTLTVRHAKPLVVHVVQRHRSAVRVHNPNPVRAMIAIVSPVGDGEMDVNVFRVRPRHTRWVPVHHRYALWIGIIGTGGDGGNGKLRDVPLTARDARRDHSRASDLSTNSVTIEFGRTRSPIAGEIRGRLATIR